ncbi:MAG: hypothetical protein L3K23_08895 [Thermoplasmata archaeon]|nr:hypothetical protein [Thermoplasmata archaeon]
MEFWWNFFPLDLAILFAIFEVEREADGPRERSSARIHFWAPRGSLDVFALLGDIDTLRECDL